MRTRTKNWTLRSSLSGKFAVGRIRSRARPSRPLLAGLRGEERGRPREHEGVAYDVSARVDDADTQLERPLSRANRVRRELHLADDEPLGADTLVTGIETSPFASLIAPGGSVPVGGGGGGGVDPAACTCAVAFEVAVVVPSVLRAVTCTRSRPARSAVTSAYCVPVAPEIAVQPAPVDWPPSAPQRSHWYE